MSNKYKKAVQSVMLGPKATYNDWAAATDEAREFYINSACQGMTRQTGTRVDAKAILRGVHEYYADESTRGMALSMAFGMVYTAISMGLPLPTSGGPKTN